MWTLKFLLIAFEEEFLKYWQQISPGSQNYLWILLSSLSTMENSSTRKQVAQVRNVGTIYKTPHFSSHLTFVRNLGILAEKFEVVSGKLALVFFWGYTSHKESYDLARKSYDQPRQHNKKQKAETLLCQQRSV